jgi:hypothetical protein
VPARLFEPTLEELERIVSRVLLDERPRAVHRASVEGAAERPRATPAAPLGRAKCELPGDPTAAADPGERHPLSKVWRSPALSTSSARGILDS